MIIKNVLTESVMSLAESKEFLTSRWRSSGDGSNSEGEEKEGEGKGEEEGAVVEDKRYEQRKAFTHTAKFSKGSAEESRALINELLGLPKMNEGIAIRIADLMPMSRTEVRAIYAKERFTIGEADIENILNYVAKSISK